MAGWSVNYVELLIFSKYIYFLKFRFWGFCSPAAPAAPPSDEPNGSTVYLLNFVHIFKCPSLATAILCDVCNGMTFVTLTVSISSRQSDSDVVLSEDLCNQRWRLVVELSIAAFVEDEEAAT